LPISKKKVTLPDSLLSLAVRSHPRFDYALCWTTGQFSTQAPQPVHRSMLMLRARFLTFTLKLPGLPSTLSRSA
jgi:hypothetical protein